MIKSVRYLSVALLSTTLLSACGGDPEWVAVYEDCKETVSKQTQEMKSGSVNEDNAQAKAMMESMNAMATGMAMTACEMIRTTCEDDPDGAACRAYVDAKRQ